MLNWIGFPPLELEAGHETTYCVQLPLNTVDEKDNNYVRVSRPTSLLNQTGRNVG